ncbi:glycerol-3-phosphate acyltransferase [Acidiferrimicrobium sp. IK]|uniref:glycerol-3-phosphate acyltransferase n=1 Tax=Acidiferrimicrobium sp. IK TaxID=2871700 RepID=UPI0021CB83EE|nr:glycerol-3-phosphate acyltransferase [Acidiferrimicrobium sp. IK]MCU4184696.1 glycerol-3-phosphate acyltransferase [Acidiferrimicrobium sp. IK]
MGADLRNAAAMTAATARLSGFAALRAGDPGGSGGGFRLGGWLAVPAGFLASSIPFSYLMAKRVSGVDLRQVGSGTVSGTGLFEVAGFAPLAIAGVCEVAKGAVGPLLARRAGAPVAAAAAAAAVAGHNWSPWLRGAGGRGLSPAIGALLVGAPVGAAVLLTGMAGGRLAGETAIGTVVADAALVPVSARVHGPEAGRFAAAVLAPMIAKRLAGNRRPTDRRPTTYLWRALLDRDTRARHRTVGVGS